MNFMNAIDTNVYVYAVDADEPVKQAKAVDLFDRLMSGDRCLRLANLYSQLWSIQQNSIAIKNVAAQQNRRFFFPNHRADLQRRQITDLNGHKVDREFRDSTTEPLKQKVAYLHQPQAGDDCTRKHSAIGCGIDLGR